MLKKFWTSGYHKVLNIILAVTFLPVLFCIVVWGGDMDYNEGLKPLFLCSRAMLFLAAAFFGILAVVMIWLCRKIAWSRRVNWVVNGVLLILSVAVYFIMYRIAREIAFIAPWDIGVVRGVAYDIAMEEPKGYDVYLLIYTNNIPISYVLGRMYRHVINSGKDYIHPELIWIQVNCVLLTAGIFFGCLTVKKITRNIMAVLATFCAALVLIGFSGWIMVPYTDTYGLLFPILALYFYISYRQEKTNKIWKAVLLFLTVLACGLGAFIKPNLLVAFIAFALMEFVDFMADKKARWKYFVLFLFLGGMMIFWKGWYLERIMDEIGLEKNKEISAGWADYFYMGENEENTGSYNSDDAAIFGEFQFSKKSERQKVAFQRGLQRIRDRGIIGAPYFWLRKMVMTFNEASFGYETELWPAGEYEPKLDSGSRLTGMLRKVYWESGLRCQQYQTIIQMIWLFCLLGAPGMCIGRNEERKDEAVVKIIFLGIFFYQMLFEARARYLFAFLPVILVFCISGYKQYAVCLQTFLQKRKTGRMDNFQK